MKVCIGDMVFVSEGRVPTEFDKIGQVVEYHNGVYLVFVDNQYDYFCEKELLVASR